jgi:hypothetical protein
MRLFGRREAQVKPLSGVVFGLVLASMPVQIAVHAQAPNPDAQLLVDFKDRVDKYVATRKSADNAAPPLKQTEEPGQIHAAQQGLAERLKAARATAKQGDIFTPGIATQFRKLLRPETRDTGTKEAIKEDNPGAIPFKINGPYPDKEPLATVPPNVLAALPKLPENQDLDYRFAGKHLLLLDARANMIIDYVPNALP